MICHRALYTHRAILNKLFLQALLLFVRDRALAGDFHYSTVREDFQSFAVTN